MQLTFVIPVFNERGTLEPLVEGILEQAQPHEVRIIFVDDGSTDGSHDKLRELHERHSAVDVLRFRRNLGKSAALAAGFARAGGDLLITMDSDLQDDPKEIPRFIEAIADGNDVVVGWKRVRHDPWHKTFPSRVYNGLVARIFGLGIHDVNCGFKALRMEVAKNIEIHGEMHRLIPVLAADLGYIVAEIPVQHRSRRYGVSKYGIERFSRGALDVLTLLFLSRYLHKPGHFLGRVGFVVIGLGILSGLGACIGLGSALGIAGVVCVVGGLTIVGLGLVAELLSRQLAVHDLAPYIAEERLH